MTWVHWPPLTGWGTWTHGRTGMLRRSTGCLVWETFQQYTLCWKETDDLHQVSFPWDLEYETQEHIAVQHSEIEAVVAAGLLGEDARG